MEQNLSPYDLEYMKLAMLKQEKIFKQQVYELHRLYRIQKFIMRTTPHKNLKSELTWMAKGRKHMNNLSVEMERPSKHSFNMEEPRMMLDHFGYNDGAIDLTLGLGTCYNSPTSDNNKSIATKLQISDSLTNFSSSAGFSSHMKKACVRRRANDEEYHDQLRQPDPVMLEQPPWLLQVLSLKMTN